jgi:hypothetical protein
MKTFKNAHEQGFEYVRFSYNAPYMVLVLSRLRHPKLIEPTKENTETVTPPDRSHIKIAGPISASEYSKLAGVSKRTAIRRLQEGVSSGTLQIVGKGPTQKYVPIQK